MRFFLSEFNNKIIVWTLYATHKLRIACKVVLFALCSSLPKSLSADARRVDLTPTQTQYIILTNTNAESAQQCTEIASPYSSFCAHFGICLTIKAFCLLCVVICSRDFCSCSKPDIFLCEILYYFHIRNSFGQRVVEVEKEDDEIVHLGRSQLPNN